MYERLVRGKSYNGVSMSPTVNVTWMPIDASWTTPTCTFRLSFTSTHLDHKADNEDEGKAGNNVGMILDHEFVT